MPQSHNIIEEILAAAKAMQERIDAQKTMMDKAVERMRILADGYESIVQSIVVENAEESPPSRG